MKKSFIAISLCMVSAAACAYAETNTKVAAGLGVDQGLSAVLELNDQYRVTAGNHGLAFDYLFHTDTLNVNDVPLNWYVGAGAWSEWNGDDDYGLRVPVGIDWVYNDRVKVYGQLNPKLELEDDTRLRLGAAVGVTYSF